MGIPLAEADGTRPNETHEDSNAGEAMEAYRADLLPKAPFEKRPAANPARKQKTCLERLPNWAVRSGPRARNEREAAARSRRPCEASGQRDAHR